MPDDQYYVRIKEEAERWLFKLPGVRAVGLGPKFVAGRAIGRLAIQVFVESKRARTSLTPNEIIPEFIKDIPTDVWEWRKAANTQGDITVDDCPTGVIQTITPITGNVPQFEILSPGHGLADKTLVRITAPEAQRLTHVAYVVTKKDDDRFLIPVKENNLDMAPLALPYVSNSAGWISACSIDTLCCCQTGAITFVGATGKVSIGSPGHKLLTDDRVRIRKSPNSFAPGIFPIKKIDADNFELVGANPADFGGPPNNWKWHKVCVARTGRITKIEMHTPIVIHSAAHGLGPNDRIIIQTTKDDTIQRLDNHLNRRLPPYKVKVTDPDSFTLPGVNAAAWGIPDRADDFLGSWIQLIEDRRKYDRKVGGIRIEMKDSETETITTTPTTPGSSPLSNPGRPPSVTVHTEVKLSTGTFGCIATDNLSHKKVLLSNAHVIFSGTDNDEVHHPDYYVRSKSCSKHKIAVRVRKIYGQAPAHPDITIDAAIARFDPDKGLYDPFIADIGPVKGIADVSSTELVNGDYRVWKRGAQTGITEGIIVSSDFKVPPSTEDPFEWRHQLLIHPIAGEFRGFMSVHGDSGSVVVNKDNKIVGLLSKGLQGGAATANRIADVELALQIKIWKEGDPIAAGEVPIDTETEQNATVGIPELFANTIEELSATETGTHVAVIVQSHIAEVMHLMETNKRFASTWQRNHGPELMQHLREAIAKRTRPMPSSIQGTSLRELLINISTALKKFGGPDLAQHVKQYEDLVLQLLTLSYEDMLRALERTPQPVSS